MPTVYWDEGDGPAAEKSALPKLDSTTEVPIEDFRFDQRNPRLSGQDTDASDEFVIAQRERSAEHDEMLQSVSTNGYLDIEPLIDLGERFGLRPVTAPKAPTPITEEDVGGVCYQVVLPG